MKCTDCNKRVATQLHPYLLCDGCWAERFSKQYNNGQSIPFKKLFKDNLEKRGLWIKEGESRDSWNERCALKGKKSKLLNGSKISESEGKETSTVGKG